MAADQVQEKPDAQASDANASDAKPDAPASAEKEAEGAQQKLADEANETVTTSTDDQADASQNDAGDTAPKVGEAATKEIAEKGEQAEATLAEKLQEDSTPKSLEELKAMSPGDLTPEQRARLGLPPLEITDLRDLAKVRQNGRVEVELNGTKVDLTDSIENGLKGENVQTRVQPDGTKIQVDPDTGVVRVEQTDGQVGLKFEKGGEQVYIEQNATDGSMTVLEGHGQIYRASDRTQSEADASDKPDESEKYIETGTGAEDSQYTGKSLALNGQNNLEEGKSKSYDDVVIEHDGKALLKFDDADMIEDQWEANWKLSVPEGADSRKLDGVGTRSLIAGEDGTTTEVMESEDGSVYIRKGDQYFVARPGFYGQVTEGAKAQEAFQAEAEKYNTGARVSPRAMVSADTNYVVQMRDGTELVEVGKDRSVDVNIPDDAQVIRNQNGSRVFMNDGTQMVQSENGTTILNSDGRVIQIGNDGSLNQFARGDKEGADAWASEAGKFELSDVKVAGSDGNSLDDPGSWTWGGLGKAFMDYSGLNTAIDFGTDIYNAGIDWGSDLFSAEPGVCTVDQDFKLDWDAFSQSDEYGNLTSTLYEDLDYQLSSGTMDFTDISLTGKNEVEDLTKAEIARNKAREEQTEYVEALKKDESKLVSDGGGKSASDVATESLNASLSKAVGKDGSPIDKAALDRALSGRLEGVEARRNEKDDVVQVDETTGMQRIEHSDGSVTVKYGEGKDAVAVTEKDGQREYITGDGALVETNDGRIYSSLGDVNIDSWHGFSSTVIHAETLTADTIDKWGSSLNPVILRNGREWGTEIDGFHLRETEGQPASVVDRDSRSSYFVDAETNKLMRRGRDGNVEAVDPSDSPFASIEDQGDGTFKIETKDGGVITLSKDRVTGNDGIAETGSETDVDGNKTVAMTVAGGVGLIDPAEAAKMSPAELQAKLAELRNLSPEELAARRQAFRDMPREERMKRMHAMREVLKSLPPDQRKDFRDFFRQQRRQSMIEAGLDPERDHRRRMPGDITFRHTHRPDGSTSDTITAGENEVVSSAETPAGSNHRVVTDHSGDEPKVILDVNHDTGEFSTANLSRNSEGDFTHLPSGTMFMNNGDILDGDGDMIYDFSSSSYGDGWASSEYDAYGYNSPEQVALEAKAEAEAQTASGLAQSVAAKVAAAIASGNVSAVLGSMSEVMGAYGTIAAAQGLAIEAGDAGLAGMLSLQTSQVNFAASQIVATTINVQENNRVGGPIEGDSTLAKGLTTMTFSIANPLIKRAQILQNMGRTDDPLVKQYMGTA